MNRRLPLAAILLSLLVLPAHAGTASAGIDMRFVVRTACTVNAPGQGAAPDIACNDASPYRVAPPAAGGVAWTVTF
jgi:hypothetical protein